LRSFIIMVTIISKGFQVSYFDWNYVQSRKTWKFILAMVNMWEPAFNRKLAF